MKQVITIGKDGSLMGLQRKPGQGLDLRQFGAAQIKRASEIEWQEAEQRWAVRFLSGPYNGKVLSVNIATIAGQLPVAPDGQGDGGMLLWDSYDDAVKAEVAVLDAFRLAGQMAEAA